MATRDWLMRTLVVVVLLAVVNSGLFLLMSRGEHLSEPELAVGTPMARSKQEARGLLYSRACNLSPEARREETNLVLQAAGVQEGDVVLIAPAGGALLAEALYGQLDEEVRQTVTVRMVDKGGEYAAAASRRLSSGLDMWLHHNSRVKMMGVATLTDLPLPSGSVHVALIPQEVHHMGPRERSGFMAEVERVMAPGGRMVMMDYADDAVSKKEIRFLEEVVAENSFAGYRGHFLEEGEMVAQAEAAGLGSVQSRHIEYSWRFGSEKESLQYIHDVFGLDLMKEDDRRLKEAANRYLDSWVSAVDGSTRLKWEAVVVTAAKAVGRGGNREAAKAVIIKPEAVIDFTESEDGEVEGEGRSEYSLSADDHIDGDQQRHDKEIVVRETFADFKERIRAEKREAKKLWEEAIQPSVALAPILPDHVTQQLDYFKDGDEFEDEIWEDQEEIEEYIFQADATVSLPKQRRGSPSYAYCARVPRMSPLIEEHLGRSNSWKDVSSTLQGMLKTKPGARLDANWRIYCGNQQVDICYGKALVDKRSPLGSIHLIQCADLVSQLKIKSWIEAAGVDYPRDLIFVDARMGWQVGDKAGLFVSGMQARDDEQQRILADHVPRTYLVAVPCAGERHDDQWDLWLDDYFRGEPGAADAYRKSWETRYTVPGQTSSRWLEPQAAIDKGANLWISKPALSVDYDPLTDRKPGRQHQGFDVDMVFDPQDFLDTVEMEDSAGHCESHYRVLQKYIEQPVLWNGYKADFRMYVLTLSVNPPVHYLYTRQFPVRMGSVPYTESGTKEGHVTNLSKAKRDENSQQADNMATWAGYIEYLSEMYPGVDVTDRIFGGIAELVIATLGSMEHAEMFKEAASLNLCGWDVILDKDLNVWLMEINRFPDWAVNLSAMSRFKYLLFADMFDLIYNHDPWNERVEQVGAFKLLG